jgi:hypothetical protein
VTTPRATLGLWALVALQLAIPASYYLRGGSPDDERFAWRMFSAVRFRKCEVLVSERDETGEHPLALERALHASWIGLLRRGRPSVIEAFLRERCSGGGLIEATLRRSCREVDGVATLHQGHRLECRSGVLRVEDEPP